MSTDDVLLGLGLVIVLAVGSQLLAGRLRLPAIVVLLPVGFLAGIATDDVHPDALLGAVYQPFVSLAVGGVAAASLWLLLQETQRTVPRQAVPAVLMMVAAALVGADLLREDAGFVATTLMGAALANQRRIDVSLMLEFHGTLVQMLIG